MDFKVNWDIKIWGITVFVILLLVAADVVAWLYADGAVKWIVVGISVVLIVISAFMAPVKIRITSTGIVLFKLIGKKRFLYSDMKSIALCDLQVSPNIRIAGSGGVMGYTGWFYNKHIGRFIAYIGSMYRTVLITMNNGRQYVVSCLNPDKLVEISRANLRAAKNRL